MPEFETYASIPAKELAAMRKVIEAARGLSDAFYDSVTRESVLDDAITKEKTNGID